MIQTLLLVFLGGGLGSVARFGTAQLVGRTLPTAIFPWHTLAINIVGALIIGALMEMLALRLSLDQPARFLLVTGFLGGFTTFSAFSLESALMLERGDYVMLSGYIVASVIGTIAAVFLGSGIIKTVT